MTLVADPTPLRANQDANLKIRVADGSGNGVPGAQVAVSAKHVNMAHGGVDANATEAGNGEYTAQLRPSMAGTWKFTDTASSAGMAKRAEFDLPVQ